MANLIWNWVPMQQYHQFNRNGGFNNTRGHLHSQLPMFLHLILLQ